MNAWQRLVCSVLVAPDPECDRWLDGHGWVAWPILLGMALVGSVVGVEW